MGLLLALIILGSIYMCVVSTCSTRERAVCQAIGPFVSDSRKAAHRVDQTVARHTRGSGTLL